MREEVVVGAMNTERAAELLDSVDWVVGNSGADGSELGTI